MYHIKIKVYTIYSLGFGAQAVVYLAWLGG